MTDILAIVGPTAVGKTRVAAELAFQIGGEVISSDSRQVYRRLDIGSGKDLEDYFIHGTKIPYHLIDIAGLDQEYNLFEFQNDFLKAFEEIKGRNKIPVLCGGTGLYIEAVIKGYDLKPAGVNESLRGKLSEKTDVELIELLSSMKKLHNKTDIEDRDRLIRAIEIAIDDQLQPKKFPALSSTIFGLRLEREAIKSRITARLRERLNNGMIEEVEALLKEGVQPERLFTLGLEYRFISQYLLNQLNYNDMYQKLNSAIHAFAKRQMTWFRRMERSGVAIHWIDASQPLEKMVGEIVRSVF